jgi:hypothetical protein
LRTARLPAPLAAAAAAAALLQAASGFAAAGEQLHSSTPLLLMSRVPGGSQLEPAKACSSLLLGCTFLQQENRKVHHTQHGTRLCAGHHAVMLL